MDLVFIIILPLTEIYLVYLAYEKYQKYQLIVKTKFQKIGSVKKGYNYIKGRIAPFKIA